MRKLVLRLNDKKMRRGRFSIPATGQSLIAWCGLLLMIGSFAWWQWYSQPSVSVTTSAPPETVPAPFALVVLDPGHGGQDSGAMCDGVLEKELTLDVAQRIDRLLQAQGIATLMTRTGDSYVSLADRAALTNRARDCIFVSIHFNEGNKNTSAGVETYYAEHQIPATPPLTSWFPFLQRASLEPPNLESESLAGFIQEALVGRTQAANRGTKAGQFFVIANVRHPAVLVEGGFLTNKEDVTRLANWDYREQMAAAITEGILRYRDVMKQRQATLAATTAPGFESPGNSAVK
jgi:N-acetylmuramoyl-L-alanine amidase